MSSGRRLTLLIAALVITGGYYLWTRGGPWLETGGGAGSSRSGRARSVIGADVIDLDTEALERQPGTYRPGRDLFRYEQQAPAQRPAPRPQPPPRPRPRQRTETEVVAAGPQPPRIDFVYLGSFGKADQRIAVFADDESIYNAMVGDVVKDAFRLVAIGYESVDLEFVDFPDEEARRLAVGGS